MPASTPSSNPDPRPRLASQHASAAAPAAAPSTTGSSLLTRHSSASHPGPAMAASDSPRRRAPSKVVLVDEPDVISPLMLGTAKDLADDFSLDRPSSRRQVSSKVAKKLSGRPSFSSLNRSPDLMSSIPSLPRPSSSVFDPDDERLRDPLIKSSEILGQIAAWLEDQKSKRHEKYLQRRSPAVHALDGQDLSSRRRRSDASDSSVALDKLEQILSKASLITAAAEQSKSRRSSRIAFTPSSFRKLRRQSSMVGSDSDDPDREHDRVPACDAVLDNSKTLAYSGGASTSQLDLTDPKKPVSKDRDAWDTFKYEIVRLTHTLRLKGWRHLPMEQSSQIGVERLSGALTNAVYVVSPPSDFDRKDSQDPTRPRHPPAKLLLRIYGPQVEHLIDRDSELQILRRLARKRIGPRLLGTFGNGRFEEFFHAQTLKPQDLRVPATSRQIAKRMRELHEGIELYPEEREAGPYIWKNWAKWFDRCERITRQLDRLVLDGGAPPTPLVNSLKRRGLVCGTEWKLFCQTVGRYRDWLEQQYGGAGNIKEQLVFAHNDTQYGNILRLQPPGESPLLLPANEHRRLVVIDFEYSNANTPGYEFANHFTEWCYNYHDAERPWACNSAHYPTPEEQLCFARAYLSHSPYFVAPGSVLNSPVLRASSTPTLAATDQVAAKPSRPALPPSLSTSGAGLSEMDSLARQLLHETRLWRVACSAQWVVWGIVQAHIPGFVSGSTPASAIGSPALGAADSQSCSIDESLRNSDAAPGPHVQEEEEEEEEEFDYLSFARDRALLFWGDVLQLGLVKKEDLPESLQKEIKIIGC